MLTFVLLLPRLDVFERTQAVFLDLHLPAVADQAHMRREASVLLEERRFVDVEQALKLV